jgi:hypothetical protein
VYAALIALKEQSVLCVSPAVSVKPPSVAHTVILTEVKLSQATAWRYNGVVEGWGVVELWVHSFILNLGSRLRQMGRFTARPFYPQERNPVGGSVCPRALEKREKNFCQLPEFL